MKGKTLLYLFLITSLPSLFAQESMDSIAPKKIKVLDSLARINPNESLKQLEEFYEMNKTALEEAPLALEGVYYAFAKYHYYIYDYEKTAAYAKIGKQHIQDKALDVPSYFYDNLMGSLYANQGIKDSAAYYYTKSAASLANKGEYAYAAQINYNIASLYTNDFNLDDAFIYFRKSLDFYNQVADSLKGPTYSFLVSNMAYVYEKGDSLSLAKQLGRQAINYGTKFQEKNGLIYGRLTLADAFQKENQLDSAYFYSKEAYTMARDNKFDDFYPTTAMHLAKFEAEKDPKLALQIMEEIPESTDDRDLNWIGNVDQFLGELYIKNNNYEKASQHLVTYAQYQDSIHENEIEIKAADILEKYNTAQKDLTIAQQDAEIAKQENAKKRLIIIAGGLGGIALFGFLFFRQRQKNQKQQIVSLKNEKENVALRSLMAGEEKERSRIAKELHDGLGGILAAAKMHASKSETSNKVVELLDTASKESRRISHNLLPESLLKKGLDQALKDFTSSVNDSGLIQADYQSINLDHNLPQPLQLSVYRIVQELLNNIIKHSGATEALVQLQQEPKKLIITVEDNGKGFSSEETEKGIGLQNIESRLSLLKGTLEIDSGGAKGTSVYIELELEK